MENNTKGKPVYLQDILHSVKRQTAFKINKLEGRSWSVLAKGKF